MGTKTTRLDLTKPGESDYYNQQTEQADNWQKVDDYAVYTDRDKNAIWGGPDGGGEIEDPDIPKEVGKRYIGADGKAYICLVPSNINNSTNYTPCNLVDNLDKLQNLNKEIILYNLNGITIKERFFDYVITGTGENLISIQPNSTKTIQHNLKLKVGFSSFPLCSTSNMGGPWGRSDIAVVVNVDSLSFYNQSNNQISYSATNFIFIVPKIL